MAYIMLALRRYRVTVISYHAPAVSVVNVFAFIVPDVKSPSVGSEPDVARMLSVNVPGLP
jgi:hypothetical protein